MFWFADFNNPPYLYHLSVTLLFALPDIQVSSKLYPSYGMGASVLALHRSTDFTSQLEMGRVMGGGRFFARCACAICGWEKRVRF